MFSLYDIAVLLLISKKKISPKMEKIKAGPASLISPAQLA
jgi:hypothetical protein